jgi:hypothetical protein
MITEHNGNKYRSRLYARWAVFFDTLRLNYEVEKFQLKLGLYQIDFWCYDYRTAFKILDKYPNKKDTQLAKEFAEESGYPVFIAFGNISAIRNEHDAEKKGMLFFEPYPLRKGERHSRLIFDYKNSGNVFYICECGDVMIADGSHHFSKDHCGKPMIFANYAYKKAQFWGIEREPDFFETSKKEIETAKNDLRQRNTA